MELLTTMLLLCRASAISDYLSRLTSLLRFEWATKRSLRLEEKESVDIIRWLPSLSGVLPPPERIGEKTFAGSFLSTLLKARESSLKLTREAIEVL